MNNVIVRRQLIERLAAVFFYHYIIRCTITMARLHKALYVKYKIAKELLTRSEKSGIIIVEVEEFEYSRKGFLKRG